jgi:hypothetical protein
MEVMETLGTALPKEIARVRDEVLPLYVELGAVGAFGATMIRADLDAAAAAMISGDLVEMIRIYQVLKETNG